MLKLFLFLLPVTIFCQSLQTQIDKIINKAPSSTITSLLIFKPNSNDTIYAKNIKEEMIPASNTKLFTTSAALYYLGAEYNFPIGIYTDDIDLTDGIIDGNVYLKGYGNSLFTSSDLDTLLMEFDSLGIKRITGDIVSDDTYFDDIYTRDDWIVGEKANVNLPPVSAIVIDRNEFTVNLYSNKDYGKPLGYEIIPNNSFAKVKMNGVVKSTNSRPRINAKFSDRNFTVTVSRGIKKRKTPRGYRVFVDDPPQYLSFLTYHKLKDNGIIIDGNPVKGMLPMVNTEIVRKSIQLKDLIKPLNKNSDNFLAECLFKSLGAFYGDEQGNSFYATKAVNTFLDENNIRDEHTSLVDGSGISRFDVMSVAGLSSLLKYDYLNNKIFPHLFNSLSIAGIDGTLKKRMVSSKAYNNFRGKTGTLNGVSTVSGYATTQSGEDVIICIFMNFKKNGANFYRDLQDEIIELVIEEL